MTYDSLVNRGDYFSAHYLAEVLPKDLKSGLLQAWKDREEAAKPPAGDAAATQTDALVASAPGADELPVTPAPGCGRCAATTSGLGPSSPSPRTRTASAWFGNATRKR
ncbi:hypothetical protein ACFQ2H_09070 [Streptomyces violaceoruber]